MTSRMKLAARMPTCLGHKVRCVEMMLQRARDDVDSPHTRMKANAFSVYILSTFRTCPGPTNSGKLAFIIGFPTIVFHC